MDGYDHPAAWDEERLLQECKIKRTRASGPGGQHRNKVETAIVIEHLPSGTIGQASERRSQDLNRQMAVLRLRVQLAIAIRRPVIISAGLSTLWKQRSAGEKMRVSTGHDDFPALLAESLDWGAAERWQLRPTAEKLGITSSQLVGFWSSEPLVLVYVNQQRDTLGLGKLQPR